MTSDDLHFEQLLAYLKRTRGFDFSAYKPASLERRVQKRMQTLEQPGYADYQDYLEVHPDEFGQLFNTILINVTDFFRDTRAWEIIAQDILPRLLDAKQPEEPIRVWTAGCASGQEAYTLAMLLAEAVGRKAFTERVKIYATDVDEEALAEARRATFRPVQVESVPAALREKYFDHVNNAFVFNLDLRRGVIFGRHDLLQDAPISRVDLLTCRNTLMYFNAEAQARILSRFEFALNPGGFLFLGKAEVMLTRNPSFAAVEARHRLFTKTSLPLARPRAPVLMDGAGDGLPERAQANHELREQAMEMDPVAHVVLDLDGNLTLMNAQARLLLGLAPTDVGQRLQDLQIYRPVDLRYMIEQVVAERRALFLKEVEWNVPGLDQRYLDVAAIPLVKPDDGAPLGVKVVFSDVTRARRLQEELHHSHQELETTNEELQSSNEELETTNEELQSTVEELETTNEELQSTNEELETMNEELQSTNEELEAANDELNRRTGELNGMNLFLEAIMAGLDRGVVVLDHNLHVRAWNKGAEELWGLRGDEARGQNFLGLDIGLPVDQLKALIRGSLRENGDGNSLTLGAVNRRGRAIQVRVTAASLLGADKSVQGAILMMAEPVPGDGAARDGEVPT